MRGELGEIECERTIIFIPCCSRGKTKNEGRKHRNADSGSRWKRTFSSLELDKHVLEGCELPVLGVVWAEAEWNSAEMAWKGISSGVRQRRCLDWGCHIPSNFIILQFYDFHEMANRQGAPGSGERNAMGPGQPLNGYISLWIMEIGNTYWASFKIPARLWVLGR